VSLKANYGFAGRDRVIILAAQPEAGNSHQHVRKGSLQMPETIILTIPDQVFQPIQRVAQATQQPVEALLLRALQASLPPLEGLPAEVIENLATLETLDDTALWQVMRERVPPEEQQQLQGLLERNHSGSLTEAERGRLTLLQQRADLVMLRKARPSVLLRFRGKRIPTLAELTQATAP
jgi:hypothetical protein